MAAALAGPHLVHAVDTLGDVCRSRLTGHPRPAEDLAGWFAQLPDGLSVESTALVGHSDGGVGCGPVPRVITHAGHISCWR